MRQRVLLLLIFAVWLGIAHGTASAQSQEEAKTREFKTQIANLPSGATLRVRLKDGRDVQGQLSARTAQDFTIATPDPLTIPYPNIASLKRVRAPSSSVGAHALSHRTKVFIIAFAAGAVFLIWAAVELRKS